MVTPDSCDIWFYLLVLEMKPVVYCGVLCFDQIPDKEGEVCQIRYCAEYESRWSIWILDSGIQDPGFNVEQVSKVYLNPVPSITSIYCTISNHGFINIPLTGRAIIGTHITKIPD
ncbi:unnamed protein product [Ambrosiozyma monospora]|uniref:Unnamed protein product n=1 Tax=Ambrosiozyma monospora TaxID=43982 RepID=A0A9W6Z4D2_AMBMO|nr:unnamed protein product [Ambrosiozyma monospora]